MKKHLFLPCLTGKFGSWRYYNIIMKIKDIVDLKTGIKSVPESRKIYSSNNLNQILQRAIDSKRIEPIKKYILKQKDRYFNSITVGISGGDPKWHPVSIRKDEKFDESVINYLNSMYGILELTGEEELFVLDGQHRLFGLREAYESDKQIGEEEISIMLVIHKDNPEGLKRTRRIFVSLNRNAKPVSEGENIILEEDDVSAIIARSLVERYKLFKNREVIAFNKNLNLKVGKQDGNKFTSILALYAINEVIVDNEKIYTYKNEKNKKPIRIRPEDENIIEREYKKVESFWNIYFSLFPKAKDFVEDFENNSSLRNNKEGGVFFLRPIGQEIIAKVYRRYSDSGKSEHVKKLQLIEPKLHSDFWNYVLWDPFKNKMLTNKAYALNYLLYHLGEELSKKTIATIKSNYKKNSGDLNLSLPNPKLL